MSFDCSRFAFNSWHDFLGVVMQQGRVQLDADWNELVAEIVRRLHAGTLDTFARSVVPRVTPNGFRIDASGGQLAIGVGRMYVDGMLIENHGTGAMTWDPKLAERVGTGVVPYTAQPYLPSPPELPGGGPHLVYVDVWQREVTYLQHPELVEKAVGVDTTGRLQTVWQVKVLPNVGTTQCGTPDGEVPGWADVIRPSGARLTTSTGAVEGSDDPCEIPPSGGYRGVENQLYRVEIHTAGTAGTATFKWSRDNGTVRSLVGQINAARDRLVVDTIGRDAVLRFSDGDWIEITDDVRELKGLPGVVRRIKLGGGVDDATRTIVLASALPAGDFPTGAQDRTDPSRHTRIRRWDHSGRVLRADGTLFHDLDAGGSTGLIPVPPAGTSLFLEHGILVTFTLEGTGSRFHSGDHWAFAARTADASIEILDQAPPRGTHHHYARLAIVNFPDAETDCRVLWPPEVEAGDDCACDRCVTVEGHTSGEATIQQAIDALAETGGVICLGAGTYRLREPLRIENAGALTIRGKGWRTLLVPEQPGPAVRVQNGRSVTLETFACVGAAGGNEQAGLVVARNTVSLSLDRLYLVAMSPGDTVSAAIELAGYALGVRIRECALVADVGVSGGAAGDIVLTADTVLANTLFVCTRAGLQLGRRALHYADTRVEGNLVIGGRVAGLSAQGATLPGSAFWIERNVLYVTGDAVVAGVSGLRVSDNEISGPAGGQGGNGIVLLQGLDPAGVGQAWVIGNHIARFGGAAIHVRVAIAAAMIKQNIIEGTLSGILFTEGGASGHVSIENNQLLRVGEGTNPTGSVIGMQVLASEDVQIVGNTISQFARDALQARDRVALRVVGGGEVRVSGNHLRELGPSQAHAGYVAGIELQSPYRRAMVVDNIITRTNAVDLAPSQWQAIRIAAPTGNRFSTASGAMVVAVDDQEMYLLTATRLRAFVVTQPEGATIRGNQASARAVVSPMVMASGMATNIFTDNHVEATPVAGAAAGARLVELEGTNVIASNNRLRWNGSDQDALNIAGSKAFTVLGNITMGNIRLNGGLLPGPWDKLNVLGS